MGNFFARLAASDQRILRRSCETLIGICTGLMADRHLNDEEIRFLSLWLAEHAELANTWPGEVILARVRAIHMDGIVDEEERAHLEQTLRRLLGGTLEETGAADGLATKLPLDQVDSIVFRDRSFCCTGQFIFGTRTACERAIVDRGGLVSAGVRKDLSYLVIGMMASHEWAHSTFGTKIEKAMEYRDKGRTIYIVGEEQWTKCLGSCPPNETRPS